MEDNGGIKSGPLEDSSDDQASEAVGTLLLLKQSGQNNTGSIPLRSLKRRRIESNVSISSPCKFIMTRSSKALPGSSKRPITVEDETLISTKPPTTLPDNSYAVLKIEDKTASLETITLARLREEAKADKKKKVLH